MKLSPAMEARMAAAKAKREALEARVAAQLAATKNKPAPQPTLPAGWVALGTCPKSGKPRYRTAPATAEVIPTFAERLVRWAESKAEQHKVGHACPHCRGTGRYVLHTKPGNNKCYRCDGKGRLNEKDLAFLNKRLGGAGPICWVVTAAAA